MIQHAAAKQIAASDPTRDPRGALLNRRPKNLAAILEPRRVGELLHDRGSAADGSGAPAITAGTYPLQVGNEAFIEDRHRPQAPLQ